MRPYYQINAFYTHGTIVPSLSLSELTLRQESAPIDYKLLILFCVHDTLQ